MTWTDLDLNWLGRAAAGALIVLSLGSLATALCRQPVRRARLVALTLLGSLLVPWLGMLPAMPRWSLGLLPAHRVAGPVGQGPALVGSQPGAVPKSISFADGPIDSARFPKQVRVSGTVSARPGAAISSLRPATWVQYVILTHVVGSAGLILWWALGQFVLWRIAREARPARPSVQARFDAISGAEGRRVRLLESARIASPFTFTWWRPVVLVPASACEGDEEGLDYSLAHEWSHVERRDAWSWNFTVLAGAVLFYQPLFWWLRRQLRLCQDYLADDRAASLGTAEDYAAYLVRIARSRSGEAALPALGMTDRSSNLSRRIVMLVQDREPLDRRCRLRWSASIVALGSAALIVVAGLRLDAAPTDEVPLTKESAKSPAAETGGETLHYGGVVKDKLTGQPIGGATVTVHRLVLGSDNDRRLVQDTRHVTGDDGRYSFTIPPEQVRLPHLYLELDVEHPNYAPNSGLGYSLRLIREEAKQGNRPFFEKRELRPAEPVTGRVETPEGRPVAGVEVRAYSLSGKQKPGPREHGSIVTVSTDREGRFRVPITTPGLGLFWLLPKEYAAEGHVVGPEKRGDFGTFVLRKGITVSGRALDAQGRPLAGMVVRAVRQPDDSPESQLEKELAVSGQLNRQGETDGEGRFAFEPLPPGVYRIEPSKYRVFDGKAWNRQPLPGVFAPLLLSLKRGETPKPIELRAAAQVVIEGRWLDSKGNPRSGWDFIALGRVGGESWHTVVHPREDGRFSARVPKGLTRSQINFIDDEHTALRHRIGKEGKASPNPVLMLGTLDRDIKDLEVIRFVAPVVTIEVVGKDGLPLKGPILTGEYLEQNDDYAVYREAENGLRTDIEFRIGKDGRYRTESLTPDRAIKITVDAKGFKPESRTFKLAEGKNEEAKFVLEPAGPAPASPKDDGTATR